MDRLQINQSLKEYYNGKDTVCTGSNNGKT